MAQSGAVIGKFLVDRVPDIPSITSENSVNYVNDAIRRGPVDEPKMAITIDDGWNTECIKAAVEFSEKYHVPLNFFLLGQFYSQPKYRDLARKALACGCELHSHSYSLGHKLLTKLTKDEIKEEVENGQRSIFGISGGAGGSGRYFRPPYGSYNQEVVEIAHQFGVEVIIWSASSGGTGKEPDGKMIGTEKVLANLQKTTNGDIVLMHFNWNDINALESYYLHILRPRGLRPVALSQLTPSRFVPKTFSFPLQNEPGIIR